MYGMMQHNPQRDFFATIRLEDGASMWEHVRTNLGRKVAYAMLAKHYEGIGKIENFRDENSMTDYDKEGLAQGSDGILRKNIWYGFGGI